MTSLRPDSRTFSAFFRTWESTNGPFQTERGISALPYFFFRAWRERRMNFDVVLLVRVLWPLVGLPQGVTGCRPPLVRPSPPPWGWSIGFMTTPRTLGLTPRWRIRPALPKF